MDEKFHEQASQLVADRITDAMALVREQLNKPGQPDCKDCGKAIPEARRKATPNAIRCIGCQTTFDRTFKK